MGFRQAIEGDISGADALRKMSLKYCESFT